jgi:HSP20 family protein
MSLTFFNPNSVFAGFDDDFFAPLAPSAFHGVPPTLTRFKDDTMRHFSPRYEVTENEKQFRLAIEVPGVKEDNMKVELENDGHFLHLSFIKKEKTDTTFTEFKFDKRFSLGKNLDTSKLTAHLSDGVLVLTAPKKEKVPPASQEIPIIRGEPPALMDE